MTGKFPMLFKKKSTYSNDPSSIAIYYMLPIYIHISIVRHVIPGSTLDSCGSTFSKQQDDMESTLSR